MRRLMINEKLILETCGEFVHATTYRRDRKWNIFVALWNTYCGEAYRNQSWPGQAVENITISDVAKGRYAAERKMVKLSWNKSTALSVNRLL